MYKKYLPLLIVIAVFVSIFLPASANGFCFNCIFEKSVSPFSNIFSVLTGKAIETNKINFQSGVLVLSSPCPPLDFLARVQTAILADGHSPENLLDLIDSLDSDRSSGTKIFTDATAYTQKVIAKDGDVITLKPPNSPPVNYPPLKWRASN